MSVKKEILSISAKVEQLGKENESDVGDDEEIDDIVIEEQLNATV